jgi:hypothetical protein
MEIQIYQKLGIKVLFYHLLPKLFMVLNKLKVDHVE